MEKSWRNVGELITASEQMIVGGELKTRWRRTEGDLRKCWRIVKTALEENRGVSRRWLKKDGEWNTWSVGEVNERMRRAEGELKES